MSEFTLAQLQEEQKPWVLHNFGERPSWMPLLGLFEEYGEFREAEEKFVIGEATDEKMTDSVCDFVIFLSDYCSSKGWSLQELWDDRKELNTDLTILLGRIAHAHLKSSQGIRTSEDHDNAAKEAIKESLGWIDQYYDDDIELFLIELSIIWKEVSKRDWKKDSVKG